MFRPLMRHPQGDYRFYEEIQAKKMKEIGNA